MTIAENKEFERIKTQHAKGKELCWRIKFIRIFWRINCSLHRF